ncbi:terminase [Clostridium botulinum]|uniref:phage terminase small subunit P27 family n=1 Tax=Clostridium botulinum TaxID=1491 RepID=UPI000C781B7B|nr:phage terminase small subunit P27 family [Clostridium botulinum]AUN25449.1 terminase [Clostridium botulinum]
MARPRQPTDLLLVKGTKHLTKKEIVDRKSKEVQAPVDKIEPPSYLPSNLKKEFNRIGEELINIGIMSNLDCEALARFIVSEYNYQKVTKKLLKTGVDNEKYIDLLLMQEKLFKMCRQGAGDLGLTISSRCKLVIPKNEEKKELTEEEKLFGGRV